MNTLTEQMLRQFTDEELRRLLIDVTKEEERRRREHKSKLIEDFRKAWLALEDANIYIKYSDSYGDPVYLENWDGFEFGD